QRPGACVVYVREPALHRERCSNPDRHPAPAGRDREAAGGMSAVTQDALRQEAARLFPGGVNSPVRAYREVGGEPPIMERGRGGHVWDAEGREYVDWVGAFGPLVLGHAHPAVVDAIQQAAAAGGPFGA